MPAGRPRNHAKHLHHAVNGLVAAMEGLLKTLGAAGPKLPPELRHPAVPVKGKRGPGKGNRKLKSALKKSWASYTPKQRAERVRKMLAGRGLKPKGAAKKAIGAVPKAAKRLAAKKAEPSKGGGWGSMTPEQRAARIAAMRAGHAKRKRAVTTA